METAQRTLTVSNQRGLHARASARLVGAVAEMDEGTRVTVAKGGTEAPGDSILDLMMLGAARGDVITVTVEGEDAERKANVLETLIAGGFGEE